MLYYLLTKPSEKIYIVNDYIRLHNKLLNYFEKLSNGSITMWENLRNYKKIPALKQEAEIQTLINTKDQNRYLKNSSRYTLELFKDQRNSINDVNEGIEKFLEIVNKHKWLNRERNDVSKNS